MSHRVLIIDQAEETESLRRTLELEGHNVRRECEVQWGIIEARAFGPDLVITTLETAQDRGGGLLHQLRRDHDQLPVLVLSPRPEEGDNLPGFRLGFDEFLLQPAMGSQVIGRIESLFTRTTVLTPLEDTS